MIPMPVLTRRALVLIVALTAAVVVTRALIAERLRGEAPRGEPQYTEALVATNTIFVDRSRPTRVILPVLP